MSGHEAKEGNGPADARSAAVGVDESGVVSAGASELELFRAGRLSREEFVQRAAERATSHLEGQLSATRLEDMRALLRSQLENDPTLSELVQAVRPSGALRPSDAQPQEAQPQEAQPQEAQSQEAQPQGAQPQEAQPQEATGAAADGSSDPAR